MVSTSPPECSICQLPFATTPSSRRHPCPFCERSFSRVDGARRHAKTCPQRGKQPQLPKSKRGRKPQACDTCARLKVQCDSKSPCARCSSRNLACTYRWLCKDASHRGLSKDDQAGTSSQQSTQMSFFLSCTDPSVRSLVDIMVDVEPEREADTQDIHTNPNYDSTAYDTLDTIDPTLLYIGLMDPSMSLPLDFLEQDNAYDGSYSNSWAPIPLAPTNEKLADRVKLLAHELEELALRKPGSQLHFDRNSFDELFTPSNISNFIDVCIRRRNCYTPITHWSTFNPEEVALPLLLTVVLGGAVLARPSYAASAMPLHAIAEKYIFGKLKASVRSGSFSRESLAICQAASFMFSLQHSQMDINTRRRAVTKRHPQLIEALRRLNLVGRRPHLVTDISDWTDFILQATCTRLVTWTFLNDILMTMLHNHPPSMTVSEMTGPLPCNEELWDASYDSFSELKNANPTSSRYCLRDLMASMLSEEWGDETASSFEQLSVHELHALVGAFQPVIFNFRTSMLPREASLPIRRALDRWKNLWDVAFNSIDPDQRKWLGIPRHAPELASISKLTIEMSGSEKAKTSKYLQGIVGYDLHDLHIFIQQHRLANT